MLNGNGNGNGHGHQDLDTTTDAPVAPAKDTAAALAEMTERITQLERQLLARGTRDLRRPEARSAERPLEARIEAALRSRVLTTEELAKTVGAATDKVREKLKEIRKYVADVGTVDQARWIWRVGDESSTKELRDVVARLIEDQPLTTAQLAKITGARMSRVNGVLVDLQRTPGVKIYNVGSDFRARWWILPANAKPANLPPKK